MPIEKLRPQFGAEALDAAANAEAILRAADGLRQLAALLEELPCLSAFYFVS